MAGNAEVFLEQARTRIVTTLDVTTGKEAAPSIELSGNQSEVRVGGGATEVDGRIRIRDSQGSETLGTLAAAGTGGRLDLRDGSGVRRVSLDPSPSDAAIQIRDQAAVSSEVTPGGLSIYHAALTGDPVVEAGSPGALTLRNEDDIETIQLESHRGTIRLSGSPERDTGTDSSTPAPKYGGGDLVIASQGSQTDDIHIHARGELDSNYGTDEQNRPRIFLDGPNGTVELGRKRLGPSRPRTSGTLRLRTGDGGAPLLDFDAHRTVTSDGLVRQFGEVIFRQQHPQKLRFRGAIRAHQGGLMIYDSGDNPAILLQPNGDMLVRNPVTTDSSL